MIINMRKIWWESFARLKKYTYLFFSWEPIYAFKSISHNVLQTATDDFGDFLSDFGLALPEIDNIEGFF